MNWINSARLIAIFAVVLLHVAVAAITETAFGSQAWWIGNLYDSAVRWCVPIFVMLSGALLLTPNRQESHCYFYRKRMSKILIPILFWSALFIVWRYLKVSIGGNHDEIADISGDLIAGKPYYHLWFLYMILGLYLFTPILRILVNVAHRQSLWIFTILALAIAMLAPLANLVSPTSNSLFITLFLSYLPYYLLGYLINSSQSTLPNRLLISVFLLCFALTAYAFYEVSASMDIGKGSYFYDYLSLTVVPMSLSVFMLLQNLESITKTSAEQIKMLSGLTFGVYLVHPIPLEVIRFVGLKPEQHWPALTIPVTAAMVFAISLLITWIMLRLPLIRRLV